MSAFEFMADHPVLTVILAVIGFYTVVYSAAIIAAVLIGARK